MADFPAETVMPPVIGIFSPYAGTSPLSVYANSASNGASAAWPAANRGLFVPVQIVGRFRLVAFWCYNGSAVAGNIDMGVYGQDGSLIASIGSTAQAGTSTLQIVSLGTPVILSSGRYFMAISASSGSATFVGRTPAVALAQRMGLLQAASQVPLANLPTLATVASAYLPMFGIAQTATF